MKMGFCKMNGFVCEFFKLNKVKLIWYYYIILIMHSVLIDFIFPLKIKSYSQFETFFVSNDHFTGLSCAFSTNTKNKFKSIKAFFMLKTI